MDHDGPWLVHLPSLRGFIDVMEHDPRKSVHKENIVRTSTEPALPSSICPVLGNQQLKDS